MEVSCEYCKIMITPTSRCRYMQYIMAHACTNKYRWLLARPYIEEVVSDRS
jgi:hypothetical protein